MLIAKFPRRTTNTHFKYYPAILTGALHSPLAHFFFRRPKFQFPPLDFGAVAQVKWSILLPPPPDRTDQGICRTRLTLRVGRCPIRRRPIFFPPLPDHSPHPQDVGATHRRVGLIYPRSPPSSIKCPASTNGNGSCLAILPGVCESTPTNVCF